MLPRVLYSIFIVIIITIEDSNQEELPEFPLFPLLPHIVRIIAEEDQRLDKRETDPDTFVDDTSANARAGIQDIAKPFGMDIINSPKQMMIGTFQAMMMPAPKPSDIANNFQNIQNFQNLVPGASK